jgi:chemotaxis protein MotB
MAMTQPMSAEQSTPAPAHQAPPVTAIKRFARKKDEGLWLMSFSDMSLILMSFFILQLSYSTINQQKADVLREAVQNKKFAAKTNSLTAVSRRIENEIKRLKLDKNANVTIDPTGVMVEFKDGLLFSTGSAAGNPQFTTVVGQVMKVIASAPDLYHLKIEGHTDDVPIIPSNGQKFASNWELSASRGISIMRQFAARGVREDRMSVQAYAHTKPKKPITGLKGLALEQARSANRRVVIRIETAMQP